MFVDASAIVAVARNYRMPLLFKGEDFNTTDIRSVATVSGL